MSSETMINMHIALDEAKIALVNGEIPVGCVFIGIDGSIIAKGHNKTNASRNGTRHAELVAIDDAIYCQKLDPIKFVGSSLYVTCEPCIMCASAISRIGVEKVYFGCHNERFGGNGSILSIHNESKFSCSKYTVACGIMASEAVAVFQQFYESENRRAPESKRRKKNK